MNILAVEDDPVAQLVLEAALKSLGHTVTLVGDGESAWEELRIRPARIVVSDWRMPRLDGLDLCRKVRAKAGDYVYFILLTNLSATEENQEAALQAGVDDFLKKPVDVRELKTRLHVASRILNYATQVKELESFLPICGYCKKIRDDHNYWQQIEHYFHERTGAAFSHGVCPDCYQRQVIPMLRAAGIEPPPSAGTPPARAE
ncbi:MAG: response regulator transcription factor [Opitutaceae bacterium]